MAEPLTKEELALAREYAESVYADTTDPQKHAAAVMMLRLLDTLAALEAEVARLRSLAEVGEAVAERRCETCAQRLLAKWALVIEAAQAFAKAQQVIWDTPMTGRTRALFEAELQARLALLDTAMHAAKKENNDAERP